MSKTIPNMLTVVFLLLTLLPAFAQEDDDAGPAALDDIPHLTITGSASAEIVPDIAEISLGVSSEKPRAPDAANETARIAHDVIETAKAQGVEARDIRTQSVTLIQTFDTINDANGHFTGRKPRGFSASNVVSIRVRALEKAGALAQTLIDKGATQFNGVSFSIEHPERIMDNLLAAAVRDAKRQAELAAGAAGVKLGRVLLIEKPEAKANSNSARIYPAPMASAVAAPTPMPVEAGTQTLRRDMDVTWAITP